jgi:TPR repeat protein
MKRMPFDPDATVVPTAAARAAAAQAAWARAEKACDDEEFAAALATYEFLASQGDARAAHLAGEMLYFGEALFGPQVRRNKVRAARWLQFASSAGSNSARRLLKRIVVAERMCAQPSAADPRRVA